MFEYLKQGLSKLSPVDFLPSSSKFFYLKVFVLFDLLFYGPSTLFRSFERGQLTYQHYSWQAKTF